MITLDENNKEDISFFQQVMNILTHARKLAKDPGVKISDYRKTMTVYLIIGAAIAVFSLIVGIIFGFGLFDYMAITIAFLCIFIAVFALVNFNKMVKTQMAQQESGTKTSLTLDKEGISFASDTNNLNVAWSGVKFMRIEKDVIFFFPEQYQTVPVLFSHARNKDKILASLKEDEVNIKIIGN